MPAPLLCSDPADLFRHKRLMKLDELSGRTTGRLGHTWPTTAYAIGGHGWHYDTLSSPQLPPPALVLSDDCGPPGAVGAWAPPPHPPEPQDLPRDYGPGRSSGRTKPEYTFGSGPTRQSDERDSEPDYLLRLTRHGQGMIYNSGKGLFDLTANT